MSQYVFDNEAPEAALRFGALEALYDSVSIRSLEAFVGVGSQCLEVGGGSGSIALWMGDRVGKAGRVVVTDINTRYLDLIARDNIEIRRHDIVEDALDEQIFDVAHTRLVLIHLPRRQRAMERMIAALKPGGWLIVQEFDALSMPADPSMFASEHSLKSFDVMQRVMQARGVDARVGRRLLPMLEGAGLKSVEAEGHVVMNRGGSDGAALLRANLDQMRDELLAAGLTTHELKADLTRLDDPGVLWPSQIMWTARGRKA